jgi:hypothetical protein
MPKYSVNEVLDIIKNLTNAEKLELQNLLPNILDIIGTAAKAVESHSQSIDNITIGNSNSGIEFNQIQADRGSSVNQNKTQATLQNFDAQKALKLVSKLKQDIAANNVLNRIEKETLEVPIRTIEEELNKPQPDKSLVEQSMEALKKGLTGVAGLAEPVLQLAPLVAKVWAGI